MNRILTRCTVLALAMFAASCDDDCFIDSGLLGESAPPYFLDGAWEGREAPFAGRETRPWWRFDVRNNGTSGTFVTDRPVHRGHPAMDTVRGTFRGVTCPAKGEIEWTFEFRSRQSTTPEQCTLTGKMTADIRVDGLLGCTLDSSTFWKALYLEHESLQDNLGY